MNERTVARTVNTRIKDDEIAQDQTFEWVKFVTKLLKEESVRSGKR
jgi:hypothetical protein